MDSGLGPAGRPGMTAAGTLPASPLSFPTNKPAKGIYMHKLLLTAAAAVLVGAVAVAPAAAQTLEKIKQRGVLVVGSKADYKPFGFRDTSGAIVGFEPDIAKLVADKLGVKHEIEPVILSNHMQSPQQGN